MNIGFDDLDVFVESGGKLFALVKSTVVNVTDGQLNIEILPVTRPALLCAIAVVDEEHAAKPAAEAPEQITAVPEQFDLLQNYPNPFNPSTVINYQLSMNSQVNLSIYNLAGQLVRTLAQGQQSAGTHSLVWDATDDAGRRVPSGVYVYRLRAGDFESARKLLLLK